MTSIDEIDPTFVADLVESDRARKLVALWLRCQRGVKAVRMPETVVRPSSEVRAEYSDEGDLFVRMEGWEGWSVVEVKERPGIDFHDASDFPYPTLIVNAAHIVDRTNATPLAHVILNKSWSSLAIVWGSTRCHWSRTSLWSKKLGRRRDYYACPVDRVDFRQIPWGNL